jgi:hypothetical protein
MAATDEELQRFRSLEGAHRVAPWGALPTGVAADAVKYLRLFDDGATRESLPELEGFTNLEYLSVPAHLAHALRAASLPKPLKTLVIEGDRPSSLDPSVRLPGIVRVIADGELTFSADAFPALQYLGLKVAKRSPMLGVFPELDLRELSVQPITDASFFTRPLGAKLEYLGIRGGTLAALDGIEKLQTLTDFRASKLTKLSDLSPLAKLANLAEVSILHCPNLLVVEPLTLAPSLRRVLFWRCKDKAKAIAKATPAFERLNLEEFAAP